MHLKLINYMSKLG